MEGKEIIAKNEMKKEFNFFYTKLYQKNRVEEEEIREYLRIMESQRKSLNEEISKEEIEEAIHKTKNGKSPGPDGYMANFYKFFKDEIISHLEKLFNEIMQGNETLRTWQQALITLLPKDDNQCPNVKNLRPISLLDYKIFAKILSERLKRVLSEVINKDQAGFLQNRHIRENVREVLNIIKFGDKNPGLKLGLFFIDAEKAFNVNWNFLKIAL